MGSQHLHRVGVVRVSHVNLRVRARNGGGALMSAARPPYDDEIDLFELFQTLWDGKRLISAFVAVAVLLGLGFCL